MANPPVPTYLSGSPSLHPSETFSPKGPPLPQVPQLSSPPSKPSPSLRALCVQFLCPCPSRTGPAYSLKASLTPQHPCLDRPLPTSPFPVTEQETSTCSGLWFPEPAAC